MTADVGPASADVAPPSASGLLAAPVRTAGWRVIVLTAAVGAAAAMADVPVAAWVRHHSLPPAVKSLLRVLRLPGHYGFTVVLAVFLVWPFRRHWRVAAVLLSAGAVASGVATVLKFCFGRTRPFRGREAFDWHPFPGNLFDSLAMQDLSFPSGDAALAFATATVVAVAFPRLRLAAFGWAVVVAITRVMQGAHYPSDVAGGAVVGVAVAALACRAVDITTPAAPR